jgi:tRNA dimethylallyltransferase
MQKTIIILGPTAIGKTQLSIELAKKIGAEIISADTVQIYKFMDVGSAKPTKEEMQNIRHYLIDIKYPDETFSSGEFVRKTEELIKDIHLRKKEAIVVGGGGFYIDSLVFGIDEISKVDNKIKQFFDDICDEFSPGYLYNFLEILDEDWANSISFNDAQRIKRGLSVYADKKRTLSSFFSKEKQPRDDVLIFVIYAGREFIAKRIEQRTQKMIENGLVDEVKKLIDMGYADTNALQSIGYKETLSYLTNEIDLSQLKDLIAKNTKAYAKRQMTLLRSRFSKAKWINVEKEDGLQTIIDACKPFL